jgi:hypothetical protein
VPFDKLEMKHIIGLIQYDPVTCAYYYDHWMKCFQKLCMKDDMIFGHLLDFSLLPNFKTMEMNMIMDFYGLQMPQHIIWTLIK